VFQGLINSAKSSVSSLILKYVARASVAIPFVLAFGFVVAAIAAMLIDRFGHVAGYWFMAGGLAAIGVVAMMVVSHNEHEEEKTDERAAAIDTSRVASEARRVASEVAAHAPLAMLGGLLTLPGGASTALKAAQVAGRNYPLIVLLGLIGLLFWPSRTNGLGSGDAPLSGTRPASLRSPDPASHSYRHYAPSSFEERR
jgi:uncharacterized membrane protein